MGEVRELDLGHRPLTCDGQAQSHPRDGRLGQRRVDHARLAKLRAQPIGDEEDATFLADVLAQHHHALVPVHLFGQRRAQRRDHVHLLGLDAAGGLDRLRRLDRVHVGQRVLRLRVRRVHARLGRRGDLFLDAFLELGDLLGGEHALLDEPLLEPLEAIALGELIDLFLGPIAALVVLGGVGAEAVDEALDQRRPTAGARLGDGFFGHGVAGDRIAAIYCHSWKAIARRTLRDVLDCVFLLKWRRDRKAVVLADEDLRQLVDRREVERFVRVPLSASALAVAGHQHLIGAVHLQRVRNAGSAHHLRRDGRAPRRDVQPRVREVARRLLAAGGGIAGLGENRKHEVQRGHAHPHAEHDVSVVGRKPVVLGLERPANADLRGLVPGARDDEGRSALPVQNLEAIVDLAAEQHEVEPLGEDVLVEVGIAPGDRILEAPVRAERGVLRSRRLGHRS